MTILPLKSSDLGLPEGWFDADDVAAYRSLVADVPDRGLIVEVGVYKGRSLCSIAPMAAERGIRIVGVDITVTPEARQSCAAHRNVRLVEGSSVDVARGFGPGIDLVFIDGDHSYEAVVADIKAWRHKTRVLAGHDYRNGNPGVDRAIDESLVVRKIGGACWRAY